MFNPFSPVYAGFRKPRAFDADARAFMTAADMPNDSTLFFEGTPYERTGAELWTITNDLVVGAKDYAVWGKWKAVYPFIGGTAARHKWNLKDPRDLDAAYRLNFQGGWTHSATGAQPDGATGCADAFFNPATDIPVNSGALGFYSGTNNLTNAVDIGIEGSNQALFEIHIHFGGNLNCSPNTSYATSDPEIIANTETTGLYQAIRTGATTSVGQKNAAQTFFTGMPYAAPDSGTALLGARRSASGAMEHPTNRECRFAYFGSDLTAADGTNIHTLAEEFETALGRQV